MADLGEFGAAVRELDPERERDTFTFCGEEFTVHDDIPPMLMFQLGASATGKIDEAEGMAALWETFRCSLTIPEHRDTEGEKVPADESDFARFFKLAVALYVETDVLMKLAFKLFGAQSGRPTKRVPGSSAGQPSTSLSSSPSSTHPGLAHLRPVSVVLAG